MLHKIFFRNCYKCGKEIGYTNKNNFAYALKNNTVCRSCSKKKNIPLTRNCPECGRKLTYTNVRNRQSAENKNKICYRCALLKRNFKGENNPFYGKNHTEESIKKMSKIGFDRKRTDSEIEQAKNQLSKVCNKRPIYDIWLEKYGIKLANEKLENFRKKQSENNKGNKNGMFGKPSPQGSGNGWSGWYKGWFFRSIRELSYVINVLEAFGLEWKVPDKKFKIQYIDYDGQIRNYFPDFIVNGTKIIEVKPVKLHNTPKVLAKKIAAEEFCKKNNMTYEIIDPQILTDKEVYNLYENKMIKFLDKYRDKFIERYKNK